MAVKHYLVLILFINILVKTIRCDVEFESLCSLDIRVPGLSVVDGSEDFEIDLYDSKFLYDDTVFLSIKQKRPNDGIREFVLRAFDYEDNVVGRFEDQQSGNLVLRHHTCPNLANVIYVNKVDGRGYSDIPLAWKATELRPNIDGVVFRADIVSGQQLFRIQSPSLKQRLPSGYIPREDQSINIDYCGETQGCLIVPQHCNNDARCEYTLSWQGLGDNSVRFHIISKVQGFVGVGFSNDEKRGDDQVVLCSKDSQGYVYVYNMFVNVQTPKYIVRERPSYGLYDTEAQSNATHISCKFTRKLSSQSEISEGSGRYLEGTEQNKLVDLKQPHYMYPIYSNQNLMTSQGMRIPIQDVQIINNHKIDFERRIWPKSHARAGSILAKIHAILNIIAWVLLASGGVMIARYFDYVPIQKSKAQTEHKRQKTFSYFDVFLVIMFTVAILTWIAFFCILFELDWKWTSGTHHMWHSILGVIVLVCAFFAPIVGVLRPVPRTKRYCCWYWIHWLIVSIAHCLAIPVIFLGMDNRRLDLWTWCSWLLFAWCIVHFIVQLIFEIHACCSARQEYDRIQDGEEYRQNTQIRRVKQGPPSSASWKQALLGFYLFITLFVVVALIIAVIFYQGY